MGIELLTGLFNRLLVGKRMPEEWRRSVFIPIYKNKGDALFCGNYRGIKLMSHTMKRWERIIEARLKDRVKISKQQYGFMLGKRATDAVFALRMLIEKVQGRSKRASLCIRGPREGLRYGSERRVVILYEKIRNGRKVSATCSEYVRGKQNSGVMCSRNYRKFQGQCRIARFCLL